MQEDLVPLDLPSGYVNNGTTYQSKNRWFKGNLVRFFQQTIQPIGGWSQRSTSGATITGTPNAIHAWQLNNGTSWLAIGTSSHLYVVSSANVVTDITPITGLGGGPPYNWTLFNFGSYLLACYEAPSTLAAGGGTPIYDGITYYAWTGNVGSGAAVATDGASNSSSLTAPTAAFSAGMTPERFFVVLRGSDPVNLTVPPGNIVDGGPPGGTGFPNFSIRRVYWASQETIMVFIPDVTNSAGSFDMATDGAPLRSLPTKTATLIWTTTDLWSMTYIGGTFVYSFKQEGTNCGAMSKKAMVVLDTGAYWMGQNKFFTFDGFVRPIPCDVSDYVFGNFNASLSTTVWALANPQFNEITWFYPSASAVSTPDSYVTFNYIENHWVFGTLARTCGVALWPGVTTTPVLIDASGNIWTHETGTSHGGVSPSIESGPIELGNGDKVMRIQRIVPDDKTLGNVTATFFTSFFPDDSEITNGPFTLTDPTSVRMTARQVRVKFTESVASAWRIGLVRLGIVLGGRR